MGYLIYDGAGTVYSVEDIAGSAFVSNIHAKTAAYHALSCVDISDSAATNAGGKSERGLEPPDRVSHNQRGS